MKLQARGHRCFNLVCVEQLGGLSLCRFHCCGSFAFHATFSVKTVLALILSNSVCDLM